MIHLYQFPGYRLKYLNRKVLYKKTRLLDVFVNHKSGDLQMLKNKFLLFRSRTPDGVVWYGWYGMKLEALVVLPVQLRSCN